MPALRCWLSGYAVRGAVREDSLRRPMRVGAAVGFEERLATASLTSRPSYQSVLRPGFMSRGVSRQRVGSGPPVRLCRGRQEHHQGDHGTTPSPCPLSNQCVPNVRRVSPRSTRVSARDRSPQLRGILSKARASVRLSRGSVRHPWTLALIAARPLPIKH